MNDYVYYDEKGFHRIQNKTNTRYKILKEDRDLLLSKIMSHSNPDTNVEIIPDENGKPIIKETEKPLEEKQNILRHKRKYCFNIINRGNAWYNSLTDTQKQELQEWYQAWLDAPETLIEPTKPTWLS